MDRIFWRIWRVWSAWTYWSADWSWFTPRVAGIFVLAIYAVNWTVLLMIGRRRLIAMRTAAPHSPWAPAPPRPYLLVLSFAISSSLLFWLFRSSSGRKLKTPYRSALFAMALAGMLGLVTELWLRL